MQARMVTERGMEETRPDHTAAGEHRILAVGKRIDHRWIVEMSLERRRGMPSRGRRVRTAQAV